MTEVYDESDVSETTLLKELTIPLTDPVEGIAKMLTSATASAIQWLPKTILTFVDPILVADDASPIFWWSFSIQEVIYHLNCNATFYMNLPWFLGVAKARMSLARARMSFFACKRDLDPSLPTLAAPGFYPVGFLQWGASTYLHLIF
ncbi:hypothetical protein DEU56DRAFT_761750 [Suillus clintonianus]|uniref:uncharacterized protein n=1 Tax=Suillus clintonianus TaxID=1904413 RepID=UPI001B8652F9|nr:uncharacterized protein DEU56DRAFT_761750 [Suillus clintonianus]KAG2115025.1 hypothetical protein DEU56DRAFT_761750 [Suillus clintonianus]